MDQRKETFIDFMLKHRMIEFGNFRLKNGRISPYIINTGNVGTGAGLIELTRAYAETIRGRIGVEQADIIFGSAYKGIPLCVGTSERLAIESQNIGYLFNRKEEKKHGEGRDGIRGLVTGKIPQPGDSIVIIDDVLTSGHTKLECINLLRQIEPQANIVGLIIAVDRQEVNSHDADAAAAFTHHTSIPVYSIVTISDILNHPLRKGLDEQRDSIQSYLNWYGISSVRE